MCCREDETPTAMDVERFCSVIVKYLDPPVHSVPTFKSMKMALGYLREELTFWFPDFKLTEHDKSRLSSNLNRLLEEGLLTQEANFERNWVGVHTVRKIASSLFVEALEKGTRNWDVTLARVSCIIIMSSLQTRIGDITDRTTKWDNEQLPYLQYSDIRLKLHKGKELQDLVGQFRIRGEKGRK